MEENVAQKFAAPNRAAPRGGNCPFVKCEMTARQLSQLIVLLEAGDLLDKLGQ